DIVQDFEIDGLADLCILATESAAQPHSHGTPVMQNKRSSCALRLRDAAKMIWERDMEGVVAKQASTKYTPEATSWVKIKNRQYTQAVGREDFFQRSAR